LAQDDYYYEIQLSNKQLVFYFMAGATGLILSFLAGVMVGRGVDAGAGEVQAARAVPVQEEKIVAEEAPGRPAPPAAEQLTYAQRLEGDKQDESLEKPKPAAAPALKASSPPRPSAKATPAAPRLATAPPTTVPKAPASPAPAAVSSAKPALPKAVAPGAGTFTIQVGAFKDRGSADSVVARLKGKGFAAYVMSPGAAEGLFNVRVGGYANRADAERVQGRLRDEEKFKPFIVKN
jgi:cell division protein FtsN